MDFTALAGEKGQALKPVVVAAVRYAEQRATIYTKYLFHHQIRMAQDFLGESLRALEYSLRTFGFAQPKWAAEAIGRVGYWTVHAPWHYGHKLAGRLFAADQAGWLTWDHWAQLSRLAERGPEILLKPKLTSWLDETEGRNAPITAEHKAATARNGERWRLIVDDIVSLAEQTAELQWSPMRLEREVKLRLSERPRGRPRKRAIDPSAPIHIPPVPLE